MRFVSIALALALAVVLSLPARSEAALIPTEWFVPTTTVIDFNSAPTGVFSSLVVGDFTFTWVGFGNHQQVSTIGAGNNALTDTVIDNFGAGVTMSLTNGNPFTVTQFDIVNLTNPAGGGGIRVDFGGVQYFGAVSQTVLRNDLVDVTSLLINIVSRSNEFAVDNIHVSYEPAAAVPEPATLTLVGLGALGMVHRLRRRKQASAGYSSRSETIGFTRTARRAGPVHARVTMINSSRGTER